MTTPCERAICPVGHPDATHKVIFKTSQGESEMKLCATCALLAAENQGYCKRLSPDDD